MLLVLPENGVNGERMHVDDDKEHRIESDCAEFICCCSRMINNMCHSQFSMGCWPNTAQQSRLVPYCRQLDLVGRSRNFGDHGHGGEMRW